MPTNAESLLHANLHEVFGERDPAKRRAALERSFAPEAVFADENGEISGLDAISDRAGEILARAPEDFVFTDDGPAYAALDHAALAWRFGPPGGEPVARGLDVLTIRDGLVIRLRTMLAAT